MICDDCDDHSAISNPVSVCYCTSVFTGDLDDNRGKYQPELDSKEARYFETCLAYTVPE